MARAVFAKPCSRFAVRFPPGIGNPGFALTEAAVGRPPARGEVMLLENSRIRALEVTLAPGDKAGPRAHPRDAAVFVIEGGRVRQREMRDGVEHSQELDLATSTVLLATRTADASAN